MLSEEVLKNLKIILQSILDDVKSSIRIEGHDERFQLIKLMGVDVENLNLIYQEETTKNLHSAKDVHTERATMSLEKKFYSIIATFECQSKTCLECASKNTELSRGENIEILFRIRSIFELYGQLVDVFEKKRSSRPVGRSRKGQVWDPDLQDWRRVKQKVEGVPISPPEQQRVDNISQNVVSENVVSSVGGVPATVQQRVDNISQNFVSENVIHTDIAIIAPAKIVEPMEPMEQSEQREPMKPTEPITPDEISKSKSPQFELYEYNGLGEENFLRLFDGLVEDCP